ncbi:MAG: DUF2207 domain-containing protein [Clostridia bacterium]|nr:DUF2207 domain-containing protein [Clostridia bacterium]
MKTFFKKARYLLLAAVAFAVCLFPFFGKAEKSVSASAASAPVIEIQRFNADITVNKDRTIEVKEQITVKFLQSGLTMFYHSLPIEGDRYYDITAGCEGNSEFSYYVATNPDVDGFLDINCVGGVEKGRVWTYDIGYTMEIGADDVKNGMRLDVVGFGSAVALHNVAVRMHFPDALQSETVFVGKYGIDEPSAANKVQKTLSADKKTLTLQAEVLELVYNDTYHERMAEGITVEFTLGKGVLDEYTKTRIFTKDMWKIVLGGVAVVALAVGLVLLTRKKRELITVVNIKAPDDMDPLQMGKLLDGTADTEDVTAMIYYFADKGYLNIDLSDEDDPKLISLADELPEGAPAHQKTLFKGLFAGAKWEETGKTFEEEKPQRRLTIRVSQLVNRFFEYSKTAKRQVPTVKPMYEKKSVFGYVCGLVLAVLYGLLTPYFLSFNVGGGYRYALGMIFLLPVAAIGVLGYLRENYRYKWKRKKKLAIFLVEILIATLFSVLFIAFFASYIMTGWEKAVVCAGTFLPVFIACGALSRTEKYLDALGEILGFKDFIVVTEEEKIKFMLEENPQLYYKVLPYAQVLGVTDEWQEKFAKITLEPPTWYVGVDFTLFDYLILSRCINRAFVSALMSAVGKGAGSVVGRSGGGGGFGGFGGGGHGGGGFGAR